MGSLTQVLHDPFWQFIIQVLIALMGLIIAFVSVRHQLRKDATNTSKIKDHFPQKNAIKISYTNPASLIKEPINYITSSIEQKQIKNVPFAERPKEPPIFGQIFGLLLKDFLLSFGVFCIFGFFIYGLAPSTIALAILLGIFVLFEVYWMPLNYKVHAHAYRYDKNKYSGEDPTRKHPVSLGGSYEFRENITHILDELKAKLPNRYKEVIARSHSSIFSHEHLYENKDTYESLRSAFLYYAGTYVTQNKLGHHNSEAAKNYRDTVLSELGVK